MQQRQNRLMKERRKEPLRTSTSAHRTLIIFIAATILAACNNAAGFTPAPRNAFPPNSNRPFHSVTHGLLILNYKKKHENLESTGGSGQGSCSSISINVTGRAKGTYAGTFTGSGEAFGRWCGSGPHEISFAGTFDITSGANRITGSFGGGGGGTGGCGRGGCAVGGKLTYTATLYPGGKTFSGYGVGSLRVLPDDHGEMQLFLKAM